MRSAIRVGIARSAEPRDDDIVTVLESDDLVVSTLPPGTDVLDLAHLPDGPDILVLDLPDAETVATTRRIARERPSARILVLGDSSARRDMDAAVLAGARGYVVRPADRATLIEAVRSVAAGHMVLGPGMPYKPQKTLRPSSMGKHVASSRNLLPERGVEVLLLAASGLDNEQIADQLDISAETVRLHFARIRSRLDTLDRAAAIERAREWGFLLGHGRDSYGIWKVGRPGPPIERFDEVDSMRAWLRWLVLCADHRRRTQRRQERQSWRRRAR